jgi:perosamine synthetase
MIHAVFQDLIEARPAIAGGEPVRALRTRQSVLLDAQARHDAEELILSGVLSAWKGGPWSRRFESAFASHHDAAVAVAVNSGTSALHCAYAGVRLQPQDEVIISASCYVSAASAAVQMGARIVVCDVDPVTLSMDPAALAQCMSDKTRVIVPVHMWGIPSAMSDIGEIAAERGVLIVEDCAQAHGALIEGRHVGTFGAAAAFSFAPEKVISTGQGGMVLCRTPEIGERVRRQVNKGKGEGWHDYIELGYSYVMAEFEAIAGLSGLRKMPRSMAERQQVVNVYREAFAGTDMQIVLAPAGVYPSYYKCAIRLPTRLLARRDELLNAITAENVGVRRTHPPLGSIGWLQPHLAKRQQMLLEEGRLCPVAEVVLPLLIELETNIDTEDAWRSAAGVLRNYYAVSAERG